MLGPMDHSKLMVSFLRARSGSKPKPSSNKADKNELIPIQKAAFLYEKLLPYLKIIRPWRVGYAKCNGRRLRCKNSSGCQNPIYLEWNPKDHEGKITFSQFVEAYKIQLGEPDSKVISVGR